jgi:hypothetical protein
VAPLQVHDLLANKLSHPAEEAPQVLILKELLRSDAALPQLPRQARRQAAIRGIVEIGHDGLALGLRCAGIHYLQQRPRQPVVHEPMPTVHH